MVICPICHAPLTCEEKTWRCENGHCFDVARQGYVNLLPVSQKHSKNPGDTRLQVAARKEFLDGGHYRPIADKLCALVREAAPETMLDIGCGEGYYLSCVQDAHPVAGWGIDISKDAVRYAAVRNKRARFLTATASHLPFADESFDLLSSMFALTLPGEFARVLKPGGTYIEVTAGEDHLLALKSLIYPEVHRKEKPAAPQLPGFTLAHEELLTFDFTLDTNEDILRLLSMTPHFMRINAEGMARARAAETLSDRAEAVFRVYRKA